MQRSTHKPKNLKRKRLPVPKQLLTKEAHKPAGKRRKVLGDASPDSSGNISDPQPNGVTTSGPRAAKLKANKKLDAQAKALAEFQRENALTTSSTRVTRRGGPNRDSGSPPPPSSRVTRVSSRLRKGKPDPDEEWQAIPDEWLMEDDSEPTPRRSMRTTRLRRMSPEVADTESDPGDPQHTKTGLESDESVSDLTDLSSDHENGSRGDLASMEDDDGDANKCNGNVPEDEKQDDTKPDGNSGEFVEWEMVCPSL